MAYIEMKHLSYRYPEEQEESLKDLSLTIQQGDIVFIAGRSGSGKSTLGKVISGAIPDFYGGTIGGDLLIKGLPLKQMQHRERAREITMVFQDPERQLLMNKVHREVAFGLENLAVEEEGIKKRVWEALQFTGLGDLAYRDISTLSGGQKQKVALASSLAYGARCIILDEPASQLDPSSAEEIWALIRKINEELGTTILLIEQRVDKCFEMADKILLLEDGKAIFYGSRQELYSEGRTEFMPVYLRLAERLGCHNMPSGLKPMRKLIQTMEFSLAPEEPIDGPPEEVIIRADKLSVKYGEIQAIKEVDFSVCKGDFMGILGANAAGKSTLLKAMMGLVKYEGSFLVNGKEVKRQKLKDICKVAGYVSQNPNDYISKATVYEELKFTLDNRGIQDLSLIEHTLKRLGIYELRDKNPRDISGGERQRVAMASILVTNPKVLLLDEPTRGLDHNIKEELGALLKQLNRQGTTIIMVTHDVEFAAGICRSFLLMFQGILAAQGTREQVMEDNIYFTTQLHKLFRDINKSVFSLNQILGRKSL